MKTLDFKTYEKLEIKPISLSDLDAVNLTKNDLHTFDIVSFNYHLYRVFAKDDVHQFRNCPFGDKADNGIFVRYEKDEGLGFMYMTKYDNDLRFYIKSPCNEMYDIVDVYILQNGTPKVWDLHQLTQERLKSIIKNYEYKHFRI